MLSYFFQEQGENSKGGEESSSEGQGMSSQKNQNEKTKAPQESIEAEEDNLFEFRQ